MEKRNPAGRSQPAGIGDHRLGPRYSAPSFFELCPHRHKPALEDTDDLTADLGRVKVVRFISPRLL
jgi:hypothetical protein